MKWPCGKIDQLHSFEEFSFSKNFTFDFGKISIISSDSNVGFFMQESFWLRVGPVAFPPLSTFKTHRPGEVRIAKYFSFVNDAGFVETVRKSCSFACSI